jgi:hypothetical protein
MRWRTAPVWLPALLLVLVTSAAMAVPGLDDDIPRPIEPLSRAWLAVPGNTERLEALAERDLHVTPENRERIRRQLARVIWQGPRPAHRAPLEPASGAAAAMPGARATYLLPMDLGEGLRAQPPLYLSARGDARRLVIVHFGHERRPYTLRRSQVSFFLARGYDVVAIAMPLLEYPAPQSLRQSRCWNPRKQLLHDSMSCLERPLRPFLEPVAVTLNTLAERYRSVDMMGSYGGGWTTVMAAAIDQRIRRSYPVAGTWPRYMTRIAGTPLDFEQGNAEMLRAASYLDMYALARHQLAIWNEDDSCCFAGPAFRTFVPVVRSVAPGYRALLDRPSKAYGVSAWALRQIDADLRRAGSRGDRRR